MPLVASPEFANDLAAAVARVDFWPDVAPQDLHDESLHPRAAVPVAVARPTTTAEVAAIARVASAHGVPITPRGAGTGLSGGAGAVSGGVVVAFDRMNRVLDIDLANHVCVVEPGVMLRDLDAALAGTGLRYAVYPGEMSASIGGNVSTNAGGMRAVRHGVTRQHVLGLELVLIDGTVLRTGGPVVKSSSGYDLTQLIVGSEGTLALVTEVTLRLTPVLEYATTLLVAFDALAAVAGVVPSLLASGLAPSILEYLDQATMAMLRANATVEGVADETAQRAGAYLVVVLESRTADALDDDLAHLAALVESAGALETYVLDARAGARLIEAREQAFWLAKALGANDILDVVVPRAAVPTFAARLGEIAAAHGAVVAGCGHVGDGNVHMAVFQPDDAQRAALLAEVFAFGRTLGGQISGEHGIGRDKQAAFLALADPALVDLQRRLKSVFDPRHLLNPYRLYDERPLP